MTRSSTAGPGPQRQRGAILLVCLVLLAVLSLLAGDAMQTGIIQQRMAGNLRDHELAFRAAESALLEAEDWLATQAALPSAAHDGSLPVWRRAAPGQDGGDSPWWATRGADWWAEHAQTLSGWPALASPPRYLIEEYAAVAPGQSLDIGSGHAPERWALHRITARGVGGKAGSVVLLQSTFLRSYD